RRKRKHSRGHVACSPSARGDLPVWALGTRGALGKSPGGVSRLEHSGQVASSGGIRRNSPGLGTRDTCRTRRLPGKYHSLDSRRTRRLLGLALGGGFGDTRHSRTASGGVVLASA